MINSHHVLIHKTLDDQSSCPVDCMHSGPQSESIRRRYFIVGIKAIHLRVQTLKNRQTDQDTFVTLLAFREFDIKCKEAKSAELT